MTGVQTCALPILVVQKVREGKGDFGYNARTDVYENLHAAGVVDLSLIHILRFEFALDKR